MFEPTRKQFFKFLLKEFFIEKITKSIWDECKKYSIKSNMIFNVNTNFNVIKSIVSSLIIQNKENIEYMSTSLSGLSSSRYEDSDALGKFDDLVEKKDFLIIYELGDVEVKTYSELLTYTLSTRMMQNKYTLLIFTSRKPESYISRELLNNCKIVTLKGPKYVAADNSGQGTEKIY